MKTHTSSLSLSRLSTSPEHKSEGKNMDIKIEKGSFFFIFFFREKKKKGLRVALKPFHLNDGGRTLESMYRSAF